MSNITCSACGKQYQWMAAVAGKRIKCQCGEAMSVPTSPPDDLAPGESQPGESQPGESQLNESLPVNDAAETSHPSTKTCPSCAEAIAPTAIICLHCGYNLKLNRQVDVAPKKKKELANAGQGRVKSIVLLIGAAAMITIAIINFTGNDDVKRPTPPKDRTVAGPTSKFVTPGAKDLAGTGTPEADKYDEEADLDQWEPSSRPYIAPPITRTYAPVLQIADAELTGKLNETLSIVNAAANDQRSATGELFGQMPAAALPWMREALERDDLDMSWVAVVSIAKGIELIERREAGKAMPDAEAAKLARSRETLLHAYEKIGHRDPKWDDFVLEGFELTCRIWNSTSSADESHRRRARKLLTRALNLGCRDAMVYYVTMRHYQHIDAHPPAAYGPSLNMMIKAAELTVKSDYSDYRKAWATWRAAEAMRLYSKESPDTRMQKHQQWLEKSATYFIKACEQGLFSKAEVAMFAEFYMNETVHAKRPRKDAYDRIYPVIQKQFQNTGVPELVRGQFLTNWAWDARGSGWASTVTEQGWKDFEERLTEALEVLGTAWKSYPKFTELPENLLPVGMGLSADMKFLFACFYGAMAADPDNQGACSRMSGNLMPRWGGSIEQMLTFGRQCLLTGNWEGYVPKTLLDTHLFLSRLNSDGSLTRRPKPTYFKNPDVWRDIEAVCEGQLKWRPTDRNIHQHYAFMAAAAEKWDIAHRSFEASPGVPNWNLYADAPHYHQLRDKAKKMAIGE